MINKYREDTLKNLDPYQYKICGRRFGKRFAKKRHKGKWSPGVPVEGNGSNLWISSELRMAVSELERTKGHDMVIVAIDRSKDICGESFPHLKLILDLTSQLERKLIQRIPCDINYYHSLINAEAVVATEFSVPVS